MAGTLIKPITITDIAKTLGIAPSTVSRALHNHPSISISTREKIKSLAQEMNYEPNERAIYFQKGKTYTIGVILPDLSESFFAAALNVIEDYTERKNYSMILSQSHDDVNREVAIVQKMKKHRIDGLLVSVGKSTVNFDHFTTLKNYNIPVVFFDRIPPINDIHYVGCNIETGSIAAVNYLLKRGHRTIGLINGPTTLLASNQRKEGYIKALQKNRLKFDPSLIINCDLTESGTKSALENLVHHKRKPTAIVTFNDYISAFALKHVKRLALNTSKNIEFVSYANTPLIQLMENGPVASVEQFPQIQAQKAVDILFDLINNPDQEPTAYYKINIESLLIENRII